MFTRSMFQTDDLIKQHRLLNRVSELIDQQQVVSIVTQQLSPINVDNITQAHQLIEQGDMIGKLVIGN